MSDHPDPNRFGLDLRRKFERKENGVPVRLTRPGLTSVIARKCVHCIYDPDSAGTWLMQIELCTARDCALWMHRPVRKPDARTPYPESVIKTYELSPERCARTLHDPYAMDEADHETLDALERHEAETRRRAYHRELNALRRWLGEGVPLNDAHIASFLAEKRTQGAEPLVIAGLIAALRAHESETAQPLLGAASTAELEAFSRPTPPSPDD